MLNFPLFHGTSSHYLDLFEEGKPPCLWPFYDDALSLYRAIWLELQEFGVMPEWYEQKILEQISGASNWRHGVFYVTPSKQKAIDYSVNNAANGGELITSCKENLDRLREIDSEKAFRLESEASKLAPMLVGGGRPVLLEIGDVEEIDIKAECEGHDTTEDLEYLSKAPENMRQILGQGMNFSLIPGRGIILCIEPLD